MESSISSRIAASTTTQYLKTRDSEAKQNQSEVKTDTSENIAKMKEAYSQIDVRELTNSYLSFYQNQASENSSLNLTAQFSAFSFSSLTGSFTNSAKSATEISDILSNINIADTGYTGKPITELTQKEAQDLVSENGYFGIQNTADRLSGFVINGSGDNIDRLKASREGLVRGHEEAKKIWGGDLPEISEKSMQKALEAVDKRIAELGGSVVDVKA